MLRQTMEFLNSGEAGAAPDMAERLQIIKEHYQAILEYYGQYQGVAIARKHLAWYSAEMNGASVFRDKINKERDPVIVSELLDGFFAQAA
jgi:tRNA-dihydrouridine synthase B